VKRLGGAGPGSASALRAENHPRCIIMSSFHVKHCTDNKGPCRHGCLGRGVTTPLLSKVSVHLPSGRVLKHPADTRKPVETGYFDLFLSVFQHTLISRR